MAGHDRFKVDSARAVEAAAGGARQVLSSRGDLPAHLQRAGVALVVAAGSAVPCAERARRRAAAPTSTVARPCALPPTRVARRLPAGPAAAAAGGPARPTSSTVAQPQPARVGRAFIAGRGVGRPVQQIVPAARRPRRSVGGASLVLLPTLGVVGVRRRAGATLRQPTRPTPTPAATAALAGWGLAASPNVAGRGWHA